MSKEKQWIDAKGITVPDRYITSTQRLTEKNAQKVSQKAKALQKLLQEAKLMMVNSCKEVFRSTPEAESAKTSFTFFTFNKGFRIEYSIKENYVRIYEATKPNPSAKDYKLIDLSLNAASIKIEDNEASPGVKLPTDFADLKDVVDETLIPYIEKIRSTASEPESHSEATMPDEKDLNDLDSMQGSGKDRSSGEPGTLFQG
jgi:hypothetical protein